MIWAFSSLQKFLLRLFSRQSSLRPQATTALLSLTSFLCVEFHINGIILYVLFLYLAPFTQHILEICLHFACVCSLFYCGAVSNCIAIPQFAQQLTCWRTLGLLPFLIIINRAAMNILFVDTCYFSCVNTSGWNCWVMW